MKNQFLLLEGEVLEVRLTRRPDGTFQDALSGTVYSMQQLERGSLFSDRTSALVNRIVCVATPGNHPTFGTYSEVKR